MQRIGVIIGLIASVSAISGCATMTYPRVEVITNIPWNAMTVKIINASNHLVEVIDDTGKVVTTLAPGERAVYEFRNLSGDWTAEYSLAVIAWSQKGCLVGSTARNFWVSGHRKESEVWILRNEDFLGHHHSWF